MKLGANSLLFGAWEMETAFKYLQCHTTEIRRLIA